MILEFDLGNTRCKWRLRDADNIVIRGHLLTTESFSRLDLLLDLYRPLIKRIWVVSVVGKDIEQSFMDWCQSSVGVDPEFARPSEFCAGAVNGYSEPSRLGADRWVGIVGGYNRLRNTFILVSFGTAVTVDLVLQNGKHVGGFIAPGINLMLDSLRHGTYQVVLGKDPEAFSLQPGLTTAAAVYAALAAMMSGLIENALVRLSEIDPLHHAEIIFTGGDSSQFLPLYPRAQQISDLVLDGLGYFFNESKNLEQ